MNVIPEVFFRFSIGDDVNYYIKKGIFTNILSEIFSFRCCSFIFD